MIVRSGVTLLYVDNDGRIQVVSVSSPVHCICSACENDPDSLGNLQRQDDPTEIFCIILMAGVTSFDC